MIEVPLRVRRPPGLSAMDERRTPQAIGWYRAGEGAGLIGAVVGALIVLVIWGMFARRNAPPA